MYEVRSREKSITSQAVALQVTVYISYSLYYNTIHKAITAERRDIARIDH